MSNFGELVDLNFPNCRNSATPVVSPSELLNKQELLSIMAKYLQAKVYVVESYSFHELSTANPFAKRDEFLKLEVIVMTNTGPKEEHQFFVKRLSSQAGNYHEREMKVRRFLKETELYSSVFTNFEMMEKDHINRWGPKYYLSKPGKLLILDDLKSKGYYQIARRECLDREHILAVIRALAAFHSATIKLEKTNGSSIAEFSNAGQMAIFGDVYANLNFESKEQSANLFLEAGIKSQVNLVDQLPGYSREEIREIQSQLPELLRKLPELAEPSKRFRNVLIHGNLGPNNLFFRRNGSNLEAVLVDFQSVRYAPPAYDLLMLLHLNQRMAFRMKERQTLIQTYYNMFSEELAKNDICVQEVLPVKDYLESCKESTEWVTLKTVLCFQIHLLSDEIIQKYLSDINLFNNNMVNDRTDMITEGFSKDEVYRTRMTEAMNDVIKNCIRLP